MSPCLGSWILFGTRFDLTAAPENVTVGLDLLLQPFAQSQQGADAPVRVASVRVTSVPVKGHEKGEGGEAGQLEATGSGGTAEHLPLPSLDPRDVELALVRYAMELAPDILVLHSAALEKDGRSVLIVGEAGAGKTTLSLLLRTEGWTLLSDDLAPFHLPTSRLLPCPRALHLDGQYPPEAMIGLPRRPEAFPREYAPFPFPFDEGEFLGADRMPPTALLHLDRGIPRGATPEESRADDPAADRGRIESRALSPPGAVPTASVPAASIPSAEVVQLLHRSVIRTRTMDPNRALPFLIELGRTLQGFRIDGATPRAALNQALRTLDHLKEEERSLRPRRDSTLY